MFLKSWRRSSPVGAPRRRLLVVVRARGRCPLPNGAAGDANHAVTLAPDGTDARVVASWLSKGNHPNWLDDGRVSMNYRGKLCAFADAEGASCDALSPKASGHPVGVPGRPSLILADTYAKEHAVFGLAPGDAGLRLVDAARGRERWLGVFPVAPRGTVPTDVWRCDLHPACGPRVCVFVRATAPRRRIRVKAASEPRRRRRDRRRDRRRRYRAGSTGRVRAWRSTSGNAARDASPSRRWTGTR